MNIFLTYDALVLGHPLKIHKRSAVIRFMFFNREDILYFKPVKLRTKMGRIGHIKEPLGLYTSLHEVYKIKPYFFRNSWTYEMHF